MKLDGYCPGCGGGAGNQGCSIARCSLDHGGYNYCFECREYPCAKYDGITEFDSFITHRNQLNDMEKAKHSGIPAYHAQLEEKANLLKHLLERFNDGRRKTLFSLAVNLLDLSDIEFAIEKIEGEISAESTQKEKAFVAVKHFENTAKQKGVTLKLKKKVSNKK